jgi:Predicted membrane protein (DUF2306)
MSTAVITRPTSRIELSTVADKALKAAAAFWFGVTLIGQLAFAFAIASFYGLTALRGDYSGWRFTHGFIPGVTKGNFAVVVHLISASLIMLAGAIQLIPQVRNRFPAFHRWNGRIYMLAAVTVSGAGVYMNWIRGSVGDVSQHIGGTVNALLMWLCAGMALRYALAHDFKTHRRWALRLFIVVSASWFIRIMFVLWFMIFRGPVGLDTTTFTGPLPTILSYAQYLIPLAVLEIYLRAQDRPGVLRRLATAGMLFVLTLAMAAGLFAVTMTAWVPQVKAAFDPRKSMVPILSATIASKGIDSAIEEYHNLKAVAPATYNFDENQLNDLGYQLIRTDHIKNAIRVLQLNVEAYPQSSNAYDSLGEAYMDDGDIPLAIANYRKSLQLNAKNANAIKMLKEMKAQ